MECEGILLLVGQNGGILLQENEIKRLMEMPVRKLHVLRLPTNEHVNCAQELRRRFSDWLNGRSKRQVKPTQEQEYLEEEVELSIKA